MSRPPKTTDNDDSRLDYIIGDMEHLAETVRHCRDCKSGFPHDKRDGYWDKNAQLYRCNCMKPLIERQWDFRREVGKGWEEKMPYLSIDDDSEKPPMTDRRFALVSAWRKACLSVSVSRGLLEAVDAEVKSDPYASDKKKDEWNVVYLGYLATMYDEEPANV